MVLQQLQGRFSSGFIRVILAIVASVSWMAVSTVLIILNKYLMVNLGFRYPMTVSVMGMITSSILGTIVCRVLNWVECKTPVTTEQWITKMLPVGFFNALTLWTGNQVYLYLTVAFIQMLKAFTPVITMICLFLAQLETPGTQLVLSVLIIACGTAIAAYGEVNMSWVGLLFMFASETAEAIRLVMTQYLLVGLKFHPIEGIMYLAPACSLWLGMGAVFVEAPTIMRKGDMAIVHENAGLFMLAAVLGFAVNTLAYTTIKLAGSLTLKVLGTVKNALLVVLGVVLFAEVVTGLQGLGYAVSIAGFAWYNQIKMAQVAQGGPTVGPPSPTAKP